MTTLAQLKELEETQACLQVMIRDRDRRVKRTQFPVSAEQVVERQELKREVRWVLSGPVFAVYANSTRGR